LAVAVHPQFAGGVAEQQAPLGVGEHRSQMQPGRTLFDVQVDHDGGVLPVWAARRVGVPAGFDQAGERVDGGRERRGLH